MRASRPRALAALALLAGCTANAEPATTTDGCRIVQRLARLPAELVETSGAAPSRAHAGVLWTHNDSDDDGVYAIQANGALLGRTRVRGAENRDWEDVAAGPCDGGHCLYLADTGDNQRERDDRGIYRFPEPRPGARESERAEHFPIRYPDGRYDTEAIFVMPSGELYLVSKGRVDAQILFRYPMPLRAGERVEVQPVATLGPGREDYLLQITGASASPSGRWIAIREYKRLSVHRASELLAGRVAPVLEVDLTPVGEEQGEGVAILDNGRVVLTSEGALQGSPGTISILQCELPAE